MPCGSQEMKSFANEWNFTIKTSSPHYPRSNGLAEKAVHICKQMLRKQVESNKDINISLMEYRATPIPSLNASPAQILMSRLINTKLPISNTKLQPEIQNNIKNKLSDNQRKY